MFAIRGAARVWGRAQRGSVSAGTTRLRTLASATENGGSAAGGPADAGGSAAAPGGTGATGATTGAGAAASGAEAAAGSPPPPSAEAIELVRLRERVTELENERLRLLADMENTRRIAAKDVDSARKFGIQKFAKDMLNVSDDISRALGSVPVGSLTPALPPFVKV